MSKNKVLFGLEAQYIALRKLAENDPPEYEKPAHIPGAVGFTAEPQGEETKFYADNIPYFVQTSNNGYDMENEWTNIPDSIVAAILGWEIDENGMLVEVTDAKPRHFALLQQIKGDAHNRRTVYYDCVASRPAEEHRTKGESIEPDTTKLKISALPIEIDGKTVVKGTLPRTDESEDVYKDFYEGVLMPTFGEPDKTALNALIATIAKQTLVEGDYTDVTWARYSAAATTAATVSANAAATQQQIDNALAALQAGFVGLVLE